MKEELKLVETAIAGNAEKSDVLVTASPNPEGGVAVDVQSVVKVFYGKAIEDAAREVAGKLGVKSARLELDDHGALDYVIRARVETALRRGAKGEDR